MSDLPIQPIKIALLAVGGDGGGVLTEWITQLGENNGYWVQYTYIAGVAQRTGATVYYIEFYPLDALAKNGKIQTPVLSQMPAPKQVDILMATELMEAGRSIIRGFVSKKTTMIFSTNRNLAISEKEHPSDGIVDGKKICDLTKKYAKESLFADLKSIAVKNKSVISSSMFGALAGAGVLPFSKDEYIKVIKAGGKGIEHSINSFNDAFSFIQNLKKSNYQFQSTLTKPRYAQIPNEVVGNNLNQELQFIQSHFPTEVQSVIWCAFNHLIDFQNLKYAKIYLEKLNPILELDSKNRGYRLTQKVAQYLGIGMSYDDLIFVSDEKTRKSRKQEVYQQVGAKENEIVYTLDYLHPGFDELTGFLPYNLGKKLQHNEKAHQFYKKYIDSDRRMYSSKLFNFLMLYFIGGLRGWRLKTLRHQQEMENIDLWLQRIQQIAPINYELAIQITHSYRLKKGYGDTYARGHSKFKLWNDFVMKNVDKTDINFIAEDLLNFALKNIEAKDLEIKINSLIFANSEIVKSNE